MDKETVKEIKELKKLINLTNDYFGSIETKLYGLKNNNFDKNKINKPYMINDLDFVNKNGKKINNNLLSLENYLVDLHNTINDNIDPLDSESSSKRSTKEYEIKIILIKAKKNIKQKCTLFKRNIYNFSQGLKKLETLKHLDHKYENYHNNINENFGIGDIGNIGDKIKNELIKPIENVSKDLSNKIKDSTSSAFNSVNSKLNNITDSVSSSVNSIKSSVTSKIDDMNSTLNKTVGTMQSGVNKAIDKTAQVSKEFPEQATRISKVVGNQITEEFNKVQIFFKELIDRVLDVLKIIVSKYDMIIKEIIKISHTIANFSENFYNKYLKPIFYEIFGTMKQVFEFIWRELVPYLRRLLLFIVRDLPNLLYRLYVNITIFSKNLAQSFIISVLLTFLIFFGLQVYAKFLFETEFTIPHIVLLYFTCYLMVYLIFNYIETLKYLQNKLIQFVIAIIKSSLGRWILKKIANVDLPDYFGRDILRSVIFLLKLISKYVVHLIIFLLIFFVIIKLIVKNGPSTIINLITFILNQIYNLIIYLTGYSE